MSVAVLTEMDPWSASTRYRALQYLPALERAFASVSLSLPGDRVERPPGRVGQARYFADHAVRYVHRGRSLAGVLAGRDAVFIQRGLYPLGPAWVTRGVTAFSGRVVLDLDDAVFTLSPGRAAKGPAARWLYGPQQARALLARADAVIVSTETLAELLPPGSPEPVILATVPDPARYAVRVHREVAPVVVGWAGTVGGLSYLDPLAPVFGRLSREGVAVLEVVSSAPWSGPGRFRAWRLEEETSLFGGFDIGIMPLPPGDYTRAKAGFKLLQYMAAGLPVIASPLGVNAELVRESGAGLLAESPVEWEAALRRLASDAALRARMGAAGRAFIEAYADIPGKAATIVALLSGEPVPAGAQRTSASA